MFDYRGLQDGFFIALYIAVAILAVLGCLYLLFRQRNLFMHEYGPNSRTFKTSTGKLVRFGHPMRSSLRLRRWTAALLATMAASHVWWYAIGQWWLADDWLVRTILVIMLDYTTLVPLTMGMLLAMLQDRRRPLWPWLVMHLSVVISGVAGMVQRSWFFGNEVAHYLQVVVVVVFVAYYIVALWQYGRWLLDNYADLERKKVWQSLVFVMALLIIYLIYTSNSGNLMREYLSQVISIVIIGFLLWRVETLQELKEEE